MQFLKKALLLSIVLYQSPLQALEKKIVIAIHQSFKIKIFKTAKIHVQGGRYIRVQDFTSFLKVTGKKQGLSYIQVQNKNFTISVLSAQSYFAYQLLKKEIQKMWGPKLIIDNGQLKIIGQLHRFSDWLSIAKLPLNTDYVFKAKIDTDIHIKIKKYLKTLCKGYFIPCPYIKLKPYAQLIAPKKTKKYLKQWNSIFKKFGLNILFTKSIISLEPNIHIQVFIAELNKNFQKQIGVKWNSSLQAQLLPLFKITDNLPVALKLLQSSGQGQILSQPSLLVKSGVEAKFVAGGEFPVKTSGIKKQNVSWKQYGVSVKIKAYRSYNNKIENHLNVEISDIDSSSTVDGIPAIKKNYINSVITTLSGRYIALSGLLRHNKGYDTDKLPWLTKLPVLGNLFKSKNFKNLKTELIIFFKSTIKE